MTATPTRDNGLPDGAPLTATLLQLVEAPDDRRATDLVYASVYPELRAIAQRLMSGQRTDHTLQATALVNEAYLKLVGAADLDWRGRSHFRRIAARAMRQILVNHARDRSTAKRGGGWDRVTISQIGDGDADRFLEVLALDRALAKLATQDPRMAEVVELRIFAGMTAMETAHVLEVSKRTVDNDLKVARLWLADELDRESSRGS